LGRFFAQVIPACCITFYSPHLQLYYLRLRQPARAFFCYAWPPSGGQKNLFNSLDYLNNKISMLILPCRGSLAPQLRFAPAEVGKRAFAEAIRAAEKRARRSARRDCAAQVMFSARFALSQPEVKVQASSIT
jgi:hypothetical protein